MSYKYKYLKYNNKYLELNRLSLIGGASGLAPIGSSVKTPIKTSDSKNWWNEFGLSMGAIALATQASLDVRNQLGEAQDNTNMENEVSIEAPIPLAQDTLDIKNVEAPVETSDGV
jgi:hypothetical protein